MSIGTSSYGATVGNSSFNTSYAVTLTGLSPATTYHFDIIVTTYDGISTTSPDYTFTTSSPPPPVISGLTATPIQGGASISWATSSPSNSVVNYGSTSSYSSSQTVATLVTSHTMTITGLSPATTYHFDAASTDQYGQTTTSPDGTFTTPSASGNPPVISGLGATTTANGATISWTTDEPSSSVVNYGLTSSYGSNINDPTLVTSHVKAIAALTPGTTYHYYVASTNAAGQTTISGDQTPRRWRRRDRSGRNPDGRSPARFCSCLPRTFELTTMHYNVLGVQPQRFSPHRRAA